MSHKLSLLETAPYASGRFLCNICWEKGCGPVYHCRDCDFDLHVACAAIAKQQTHFSHYEHPLHLCHCSTHHTCDVCGEGIHRLAFRCEACDFDIHSLCVRAPRFILHPAHAHPLTLINSPERQGLCNACEKETTDFSYQCRSCNYRLHQFCATLPSRITHWKHSQHMLMLLWKPQKEEAIFTCHLCRKQGKSWRFYCSTCGFYVHLRCMPILHELPHPDLENSLQEGSDATTISSPSVLHNVSCAPKLPGLSRQDLEAVERVLCFAREIVDGPSTQSTRNASGVLRFSREIVGDPLTQSTQNASESCTNDAESDTCPTCLEGYDAGNPKRRTSCGHHFHLVCILKWMERSPRCPICRKSVNILL